LKKTFFLTVLCVFLLYGFIPLGIAEEKGCNEISGWLIYPEKDKSPVAQEVECGKEKMFRIAASDGNIIASMPVPKLPEGYEFNHGECRLNGIPRNDIIAIVRHSSEKELSTDVLNAWIADPETKSFRPVSVKGLSCFNTGYGI